MQTSKSIQDWLIAIYLKSMTSKDKFINRFCSKKALPFFLRKWAFEKK